MNKISLTNVRPYLCAGNDLWTAEQQASALGGKVGNTQLEKVSKNKRLAFQGKASLIITLGSEAVVLVEGPEGVKWELGYAHFSTGKMRFGALGLGFGDWEWEKVALNGKEKMSYRVYRSFETLVKSLNAYKIVLKKAHKCLKINRCQTSVVAT